MTNSQLLKEGRRTLLPGGNNSEGGENKLEFSEQTGGWHGGRVVSRGSAGRRQVLGVGGQTTGFRFRSNRGGGSLEGFEQESDQCLVNCRVQYSCEMQRPCSPRDPFCVR